MCIFVETIVSMKTKLNKRELESLYLGKTIEIVELSDEPFVSYSGRTGLVEYIDDIGMLHGTWGSLAIIPEADEFIVLDN